MSKLLLRKLILLSCLVLIFFGCINFGLSDTTQVGYSDFVFLYDSSEYTTLSLPVIGGSEFGFDFKIYNKENTSVSYKFGFVDGYITTDGFGNRACKSDNETSVFGQYIFGDKNPLTIGPSDSGSIYLTGVFPDYYSGLYVGCITYSPVIVGSGATYLNTLPRRAGFIEASVTPSTSGFVLIIKPTFRPNNATQYTISGADFWFFIFSGGAWTGLYNSAKNPANPKVNINRNGLGVVSLVPPVSGTQYLLAFKGSGTLSLGYTGIWNSDITEFNFFSGALADGLSGEFMFKYYAGGITGNYLKVGDILASTTGSYDLVKDADFTLMTNNLTLSSNISHPYRFDLDINSVINALEQTMLLDSYNRVGFITIQNYLPITDFLSF